MRLDETDIQKALNDVFNFTVAVPSDQTDDAIVTFDTADAVVPATA